MSTLEVSCANCATKLRVRAEFAGRSTRCPSCSSPITIGTAAKAPVAAREESESRPRSRPRDTDDEPRRPAHDWMPIDLAFRREQLAVVFVLIGIVCDYFAFCLTSAARSGNVSDVAAIVVIVFVVIPSLFAASFGMMARIAALRVPATSLARPSAVASLICAIITIGALVVLSLGLLVQIDLHEPMELLLILGGGALLFSLLAAVATFVCFAVQVGIYRKSAGVSRSIANLSTTIMACLLGLIALALIYALANSATSNSYGYSTYRNHSDFFSIMLGIFMPLGFGIILILYHRLLAAGRRSIEGD